MTVNKYSFSPLTQEEFEIHAPKAKHATFYNTKERINFLTERLRNVKKFAISENGEPKALLTYQKVPARSGAFLYFQHTPLFIDDSAAHEKDFWSELYKFAYDSGNKEGAVYVRLTPRILKHDSILAHIEGLKYQKAPVQDVDASVTRILNVAGFTDESMDEYIKEKLERAIQSELSVTFNQDKAGLESFMTLYKSAMAKSSVIQIPTDYMRAELESYLAVGKLVIALVHDKKGTLYAASATVLDGDKAWYYWSAATDKGTAAGADGLMVRELITFLKDKGYTTLDMWGEVLSSELSEKGGNHPWSEIDKFKKGFGSELVEYIPPIDIPINQAMYRASVLYQRFTLRRRGYPMTSF